VGEQHARQEETVDKFWRTARSAAVPGVALAVRLREMAPGIPVIIMSEAELPGKDQITCEGTIFKSCKSRFGERYRSQSVTTPPGTSKWNKIEHRLFSFISLHWKGEPLVSYETIVNLIGATRTSKGLKVRAQLDPTNYEAGVKISDEAMELIKVRPDHLYPVWNYTISP